MVVYSLLLNIQCTRAQQRVAENTPSKTTSRTPVDSGPAVWGVFDGRVACQDMAAELKVKVPGNCEILKWVFTFYQDPRTHQPGRYKLFGSLYREQPREGRWAIVKGTKADPDARVIQLDPGQPERSVYLLIGDKNVLFILDRDRNLKVGNDYLSYTFNRVVN